MLSNLRIYFILPLIVSSLIEPIWDSADFLHVPKIPVEELGTHLWRLVHPVRDHARWGRPPLAIMDKCVMVRLYATELAGMALGVHFAEEQGMHILHEIAHLQERKHTSAPAAVPVSARRRRLGTLCGIGVTLAMRQGVLAVTRADGQERLGILELPIGAFSHIWRPGVSLSRLARFGSDGAGATLEALGAMRRTVRCKPHGSIMQDCGASLGGLAPKLFEPRLSHPLTSRQSGKDLPAVICEEALHRAEQMLVGAVIALQSFSKIEDLQQRCFKEHFSCLRDNGTLLRSSGGLGDRLAGRAELLLKGSPCNFVSFQDLVTARSNVLELLDVFVRFRRMDLEADSRAHPAHVFLAPQSPKRWKLRAVAARDLPAATGHDVRSANFPEVRVLAVATELQGLEQVTGLPGWYNVEVLLHVHPTEEEAAAAFESPGLRYAFGLPAAAAWQFICNWPDFNLTTEGRLRSRRTLYVWRDQWEAGQLVAPSLRVSCLVPRVVPLVAEEDVMLKLSFAERPVAYDPSPDWSLPLRVQAVPTPKQVQDVVVCTEPLHDLGRLERRWPGLVTAWLEYHLVQQGVSAIQLYDTDGSAAPILKRYAHKSRVQYHGWFLAGMVPAWGGLRCPKCGELLAYDHCILTNRGSARWLLRLHSVDEWLVSPLGAHQHRPAENFAGFLRQLHRTSAQLHRQYVLPRFDFLGPPRTNEFSPIHAWTHRMPMATDGQGTVLFDPNEADYLNTHGVVARRPLSFEALQDLAPPPVLSGGWRAFHYYDLFKLRSTSCVTDTWTASAIHNYLCFPHGFKNLTRDKSLAVQVPWIRRWVQTAVTERRR